MEVAIVSDVMQYKRAEAAIDTFSMAFVLGLPQR